MHDVLEHVVYSEMLLDELCRVSKKKVVIVGPNYISTNLKRLKIDILKGLIDILLGKHKNPVQLINPYFQFLVRNLVRI